MNAQIATRLEVLIEALEYRAVAHVAEKTSEGAREAQTCDAIVKYLDALNAPSRETAALETEKAFEEFRRNFGRNLTMTDVLSHVDSLPPGSDLEAVIGTRIERLTTQRASGPAKKGRDRKGLP